LIEVGSVEAGIQPNSSYNLCKVFRRYEVKSVLYKIISFTSQLALVLSLVSCATTTTIKAVDKAGKVDEGVQIYLDGVHEGNGQVRHRYTFATAFTSASVKFKKEGCDAEKTSAFLNRVWPYFAGAFVLVLGAVTIQHHIPYNLDSVERNGVINTVLLSMVASFIGLAGLNDPLHSYHFQCKTLPAVSKSVEPPPINPSPTINASQTNTSQTDTSQQKSEVTPEQSGKADN